MYYGIRTGCTGCRTDLERKITDIFRSDWKTGNFFPEEKLHIEAVIDAMEKSFDDGYDRERRNELKALTKEYLEKFLAGINK